MTDLAIVGLYAFGAVHAHQEKGSWSSRLANSHGCSSAVEYILIGTGALHIASLAISLWLGLMFRKVSLMPPDMNPLEDHLTARPSHRRNKLSVATISTSGDDSTCSASVAARDYSRADALRPPSIPFMHTRAGSSHTASSTSLRPKPSNEPVPGFAVRTTPHSAGPASTGPVAHNYRCGSYMGLPVQDPGQRASPNASQTRIAKFTEAWLPTDSLVSRTNHRTFNSMAEIDMGQVHASQLYSAVPQEYNLDDSSESEETGERASTAELPLGKLHPNPLRSHPALRPRGVPTTGTAYLTDSRSVKELPGRGPLSDVSGNQRQASLSRDIVDQLHARSGPWSPHRRSSIQAEDDFCLKSPTKLMCATPPAMIGSSRKTSSGNDYASRYPSMVYGRRNVSGRRQAEEGRVGARPPPPSCAI